MKIIITNNAKIDLNDIISYISEKNSSEIAKKQYQKIKEKILVLKDSPEIGRIIPELERLNIIKYREIIINPWRIFYYIENDLIYILHIIDGRRNIEDILMNKILKYKKL